MYSGPGTVLSVFYQGQKYLKTNKSPYRHRAHWSKQVLYFILLILNWFIIQFSQFSHSVISDYLRTHGLQHARPPCPSATPGACSNSRPSNWWCHPIISSSVIPFSSCRQSFPASGSFAMSQFFTSGGQRIGTSASASVLPMNIQGWFPLGFTGLISLLSKGLSSIFSNTTVQKHQFSGGQLSFITNLYAILPYAIFIDALKNLF